MTTQEKIKVCMDAGYRIYPKPFGSYYKIVVAKSTKYRWSDIPKENRSGYEEVDKIIYSVKMGEMKFNANPKHNEPKWHEKIVELYLDFYKKLESKKVEKNGVD